MPEVAGLCSVRAGSCNSHAGALAGDREEVVAGYGAEEGELAVVELSELMAAVTNREGERKLRSRFREREDCENGERENRRG